MIDSGIVFLDSGIGGLPYLDWVRENAESLPLVYVADTANFPYGELPEERIRQAVLESAVRIFEAGTPHLLVLACNTASVTALDDVRKMAPCPVVGTVPAVKPAGVSPGNGVIGVLATERTINSPYLDELIAVFAMGRPVVRVAAGNIVRYVEERWLDEGTAGLLNVIEPAIGALHTAKAESLVVGCTHFLHVLTPLAEALGPAVTLLDSRAGVGRRVLSLTGQDGNDASRRSCFYVTQSGDWDLRYRRFARRHGLEWAGELSGGTG